MKLIVSAVFDGALELHKKVEESAEDTNSSAFQERVKKGELLLLLFIEYFIELKKTWKQLWRMLVPLLWIRIRIGVLFRSFMDPDPHINGG